MTTLIGGCNVEAVGEDFVRDLEGALAGAVLERMANQGETEVDEATIPSELPEDIRDDLFFALDQSALPSEMIHRLIDMAWNVFTEQVHEGCYMDWDPADYLTTPAGTAYDEIFIGLTKIEEQARHLGDQAHALLRLDDALEPPERDRLAHAVEAWCGTIGSIANNAAAEIQTVTEDVR